MAYEAAAGCNSARLRAAGEVSSQADQAAALPQGCTWRNVLSQYGGEQRGQHFQAAKCCCSPCPGAEGSVPIM